MSSSHFQLFASDLPLNQSEYTADTLSSNQNRVDHRKWNFNVIFAKVRFQLCSFHRAESHKVRGRTSVKRGPAQYKYSGHWVWPPGPARDNYSSGPRGREQQRSHTPPAPTHGTSNPGGLMVTFAAKNAIAFLGRLLVSISPAQHQFS